MKYFSTFSGIGGFELAIQQAYGNKKNREYETRTEPSNEMGNIRPIGDSTDIGSGDGNGRRTCSINTDKNENNLERQHISKESESEERTQGRVGTADEPGEMLRTSDRSAPLCVGYSEIDKYAVQIYEKHFNHKNYGDITKINAEELPDFDLLVGGFPCQAFSIAGKRKGFDDTRGTLFFDLARILRAKQPRLFCFENVKGLLSHDNGNTFRTIIATLNDLGYDLQWQVLNSKNHGVPQNRERIFIIGNLRGTPRPEVFPFGQDGEVSNGIHGEEQNISADETPTTGGGSGDFDGKDVEDGKIGQLHQLNNPTHSNNRIYGTDGLSPTINTAQGGMRQPKIVAHYGHKDKPTTEHEISPTLKAQSHGHEPMVIPVLTPDRPIKRQNGRRFKENGDPSFTLTAQDKHGISDGMKIRRLTPTECERLQGFPDGWTESVSDTQRYKTLGNAVTVNTVRDVMEKLLQ